MTPLDRIRRLCEQATEGPWFEDPHKDGDVLGICDLGPIDVSTGAETTNPVADAAFIAHARQVVTLLLDVADAERDSSAGWAGRLIAAREALDAYAAEHLPEVTDGV